MDDFFLGIVYKDKKVRFRIVNPNVPLSTLMNTKELSGRNRRLLNEWKLLDQRLAGRKDMRYRITKRNLNGLPVKYLIEYGIRSICQVNDADKLNKQGSDNSPVFASVFFMQIDIPENYPCIDAPVSFRFLTQDSTGEPIPHPWHPNIRFFGEFAGRVCLNTPDSYTSLAWCVERVALYLCYDLYHAFPEPPYPEDLKVAEWVLKQGEPKGWIFFGQECLSDLSNGL